MGGYERECLFCASWESAERRQGRCSLHRFVMPAFSDMLACRDWRAKWDAELTNQYPSFEPGYLYSFNTYRSATRVGRFEELQEFLMDRDMTLYENPEYGWTLYLDHWLGELFPPAGQSMAMKLDDALVPFSISDVAVTTTYTNRDAAGTLVMEDRRETRRVAIPAAGHAGDLLRWIERHHDLPKARVAKAKSLLDPKILYKDKVLRIMVRVVGAPLKGRYELVRFDP